MSEELASMTEEISTTVNQVSEVVQNMAEMAQRSSKNSKGIQESVNESTKAMQQVAIQLKVKQSLHKNLMKWF